MSSRYVVYSDGACRGNPGPGGWGAVVQCGGVDDTHHRGRESHTTNNRMELTAAIQGLQAVPPGSKVLIHTDSQYVIKGITTWIHGWKQKNWKTAGGGPVKNVDLWQVLEIVQALHVEVEWVWVKGHAGNPGNEMADRLATSAIDV